MIANIIGFIFFLSAIVLYNFDIGMTKDQFYTMIIISNIYVAAGIIKK